MIATTPKLLSRALLLLALALPVLAAPSGSSAQDQDAEGERAAADDRAGTDHDEDESAAESRATGFRAVDGALVEDVPGGLMLVGAYGAIAVLLLAFLLRQQAQLGALAKRIDSLRSEIDQKRGGDDAR